MLLKTLIAKTRKNALLLVYSPLTTPLLQLEECFNPKINLLSNLHTVLKLPRLANQFVFRMMKLQEMFNPQLVLLPTQPPTKLLVLSIITLTFIMIVTANILISHYALLVLLLTLLITRLSMMLKFPQEVPLSSLLFH